MPTEAMLKHICTGTAALIFSTAAFPQEGPSKAHPLASSGQFVHSLHRVIQDHTTLSDAWESADKSEERAPFNCSEKNLYTKNWENEQASQGFALPILRLGVLADLRKLGAIQGDIVAIERAVETGNVEGVPQKYRHEAKRLLDLRDLKNQLSNDRVSLMRRKKAVAQECPPSINMQEVRFEVFLTGFGLNLANGFITKVQEKLSVQRDAPSLVFQQDRYGNQNQNIVAIVGALPPSNDATSSIHLCLDFNGRAEAFMTVESDGNIVTEKPSPQYKKENDRNGKFPACMPYLKGKADTYLMTKGK